MLLSEYRPVPEKNCIKLTDLVAAIRIAGERLGYGPVSPSMVTGEVYSGLISSPVMLFNFPDGAFLTPYSMEWEPIDDARFSEKLSSHISEFFNSNWWNPRASYAGSNSKLFLEITRMAMLKSDADAVWDGICNNLFEGKGCGSFANYCGYLEDTKTSISDCRLISIAEILENLAGLSGGKVTLKKITDAFSKVFDGDTMMIYRGGERLARPLGSLDILDIDGYNSRVEIADEISGSFSDDMTIKVRGDEYQHSLRDFMVLKEDGEVIAQRIWNFFFPDEEIPADESGLSGHPDVTSSNSTDQKQEYSTPLLVILNAAIYEFFEPRRDVDPKKADVIAWIKDQMTKANQADSENIAQAMFTIIKRLDHDPRKRRG